MIRKTVILILSFIVAISTIVGVYAWITKPTSGIDLNVRGIEIFSASTVVTLNNQSINYNSSNFNQNDLTVTLTAAQVTSNTSGGSIPLSFSVAIDAYKNLKVRLKIVETWTNSSNIVLNRPNVFTWQYDNTYNDGIDSQGYFYYSQEVLKETSDVISFITSANVNTGNIPANSTVKLTVIVSAVQSNREDIWDTENHRVKSFVFSSAANNRELNVVFNNVSNQQYARGVYVEFRNGSNHFSYIWHTRSSLAARLNIPAGTYNVTVNLVNHLDFTISHVGSVITINIAYGNPGTWGFEDALYSPSMIAYWESNVAYVTGNMVYYQDLDGGGVNAGYYVAIGNSTNQHPDTATWSWRKISPYFESGTVYPAGTIVFYQGAFYLAKAQNSVVPTTLWAWERLDRAFNGGNTYPTGSVVYHTANNVKTWYYAFGAISSGQGQPQSWQSFRALGFTYNSFNIQKYRTGEYVLHQGFYYVATQDNTYEAPSASSQVWRRLGFNYTNVQSYPSGYIVLYGGNYYIATAAIGAWASVPGSNANWRILNNMGNHNMSTTYVRYQRVTFNDKTYFWNGVANTTGTNPETDTNWWLIGEEWHHKNTYAANSLVFYDNSYWALRTGTSSNQVPGVSGAWQELSDRWTPTNIYLNNAFTKSMVMYGGGIFMWNGTNNTNSATPPGTAKNGWQELTEIWRPFNVYAVGDKVIYDGSFWEALQVPVDGNGDPVVPGTNFMIWKEYQIIWDPNRS